MVDTNLAQLLSKGLLQLDLDVGSTQKLMDYVSLLDKWNKAYNITAIRDVEQMIILHVLDSASVYRYLSGKTIIDVGTGGGIPGIIIAILNPSLKVTLLDSNHKKMRFLRFAQRELKLQNISIVCERVEKYQPNSGFDVVISRAFSEVGQYLQLVGHLCEKHTKVLAMKGPRIESEKNASEKGFDLVNDIDIKVPFLEAKRRLLIFKSI